MRARSWLVVGGVLVIAGAGLAARGRSSEHPPTPPAAAPVRDAPALANLAAYIPAQCYARTRVAGKPARNPCMACHQTGREPNYVDDEELQTLLAIPRYATVDRWTNVLRPPPPVADADAALLAYVRADNYHAADGAPAIRASDGDEPACAFAPDDAGWDRDPRGALTGWRAYAYAPMPGMFWPTNGSAGDAFIRLPAAYRRAADGTVSQAIYAINLAIVEATIRRADVAIAPTDERALGVDLDGDGALATARHVHVTWPPVATRPLHYVGQAAALDPQVAGWPAAGLFPVGTEIIHSVRYLDVDGERVRPAARMKEVRYARKRRWLTYGALDLQAKAEQREQLKNPDALRRVYGDGDRGIATGLGWTLRGYIEAADGTLRAQTTEETAACIGCHGGVGATVDGTYSFARKVGGADPDAGWYAWGARGFRGIAEPVRADGRGEYLTWLEATGAGDDFASNTELAEVFDRDGHVRPERARAFARDIATLVVPSPARALALDRAYLAIVRAQSFVHGRDVIVGTPAIEARLEQDAATGVTAAIAPP